VLFVHGIPDTSALWTQTIDALSDAYCCVTIDLPGFGDSNVVGHHFDWSFEHRAGFLVAVLDAVSAPEAVVVAHDAGGTFAIPLVATAPERAAAALFCTTSMHPDFQWHPFAELCRTPVVGEQVIASYDAQTFAQGVRAFSGPLMTDELIAEVFARVDDTMRSAILDFYPERWIADVTTWLHTLAR
jgi:pimeloyl-ACP methyl ester carboxylesterase